MRIGSTPALPHYLQQVKRRLKLGLTTRGVALGLGAALLLTVPAVLLARRFGFAWWSVVTARSLLFGGVAIAALWFLVRPLSQLRRATWVRHVEREDRAFAERVRTYLDRARDAEGPMVELLAHDTFERAGSLPPARLVPGRRLAVWALGAAAALATLFVLARRPGYVGHGTSLLWVGWMKPAPAARQIAVTPGSVTMRRRAELLVRAEAVHFYAETASLSVQHDGGPWESVPMAARADARGFEFVVAGVDADLRYRVGMGDTTSAEFEVHVEEMPQVRGLKHVYHYPDWTELPPRVEETGGDIRAVAGTQVEIQVETDRPLHAGVLRVDDARNVALSSGGAPSRGQLTVEGSGRYYVAALYQGEIVRLSDDYLIEETPDRPPVPKMARPGRDVRATSIEEVTVRAAADDDFGVRSLELRYSVNGGREVVVPLSTAATSAGADHTVALEPHTLAPGDLVSYYAVARDAKTEQHTDMYFIEVTPFEREFLQSQESGGGSSGGAAGNESSDIARRQRELVVATWNLTRDRASGAPRDDARTLSALQTRLQRQARTLAERMRRRELADVNRDFQTFVKEMDAAAEEMGPSADRLSGARWSEALPPEQRALQHLLRAEAVFRRIQVSFGRQAGGGGESGSESRDLAEMFDLELDAQKNQYETRQQASAAAPSEIDELQRRLRELARRQEQAAERERRGGQTTPESRWQQQVLRRDIEQLMRELQQAQQRSSSAPQAAESRAPQGSMQGSQQGSREGSQRGAETPPGGASGEGQTEGQAQAPPQGGEGEARERAARRLQEAARELQEAERTLDPAERARAEARARQRLREAEEALAEERQQQRRAAGARPMDRTEAERALESLQRARGRLEEMQARAGRPGEAPSREPGPEGERGGERESGESGEGPGPREGEPRSGAGGGGEGRSAAPRGGGGRGSLTGEEASRLARQALADLTGAARAIGDDAELGSPAERVREEIQRLASRSDLGRDPDRLQRELQALLRATDPLEAQLRRRLDANESPSVRALGAPSVPPEHRDAIAEYYRRLSEAK